MFLVKLVLYFLFVSRKEKCWVEEKIDSHNQEEQIANDRNFYKALRGIKHKYVGM